jgi:hypothetical protein
MNISAKELQKHMKEDKHGELLKYLNSEIDSYKAKQKSRREKRRAKNIAEGKVKPRQTREKKDPEIAKKERSEKRKAARAEARAKREAEKPSIPEEEDTDE